MQLNVPQTEVAVYVGVMYGGYMEPYSARRASLSRSECRPRSAIVCGTTARSAFTIFLKCFSQGGALYRIVVSVSQVTYRIIGKA